MVAPSENKALAENAADDDSIPRDIDELRFELERRIQGIIDAQDTDDHERLSSDCSPGQPSRAAGQVRYYER